jgi:predicted glycoside hydrolase/deacetylase ChbG (UPF0249 family)
MKKSIVLCADDYGQAPAISQGIITLIQHGRLSATSCLVNTSFWLEHAKWLLPYRGQIDMGLHFNLTEGKALSQLFIKTYGQRLWPLTTLLRKAFFRDLNQSVIEAECQAQITHFEESMGFLPRFIDGHQHVHQFPIIRDALMKVYNERLSSQKSYIRLTNEKIKLIDYIKDFKKIVIHSMGTKALKHLLEAHHIPHNQTFAGIYSFSKMDKFDELFPQFLQEIGDKGLIMCHPGLQSAEGEDAIAKARFNEYRYFFSGKFLEDCVDYGIVLKRFT